MKPVLLNKRKYSYKDVLKMIVVFMGHYFFFIFYVAVILGIRFALYHDYYFPDFSSTSWLLYYSITIAPGISGSLHIIYAEKGSPWFRFAMWLHAMFNLILVPVIALV